jgi:urea transport system substrate-binding protein
MTQDPRVGDLHMAWKESRRDGRSLSAEELCLDCPDLLDELSQWIRIQEGAAAEAKARSGTVADPSPTRNLSAEATPAESVPVFTLPGFDILSMLGRGGMGIVYKARQTGLDRMVAVKMVLTGQHASLQERARFDSEARLIARLNHPHIVQIYAIGEHEGVPYFVMEFMEGGSLHDAIHGQRLPPSQAAAILEPLARAVHHAHQQGVVHRDLKPANVLLRSTSVLPTGPIQMDAPKICDFGLARHLEQERLTRVGSVVGTPAYMAPEQAVTNGSIGPWTDIYSLGTLLYEMLTGRVPFDCGQDWQIMQAVVAWDPEPPSTYRPEIPTGLEAICLCCMRKLPAERYPSAEALADDLRRFLDGKPVVAEKSPWLVKRLPPRLPSRRRWLVGTAVAVPVAAAAWVGFSMGWFGKRPPLPPLRLGLLQPTSGSLALSGGAVVDSERLAIKEINQKGGVLGRLLEAVVGDSDSTPEGIAHEANRLIEKERVDVLIGGWTSPDRKAIEVVLQQHNRLLFYPVEFEGLEQSPHVVYLGALPNQLILPAVRWLIDAQGRRRLYLVGLDAIYAQAVKAILEDGLPSLKGELCGQSLIPGEGADMKGTAEAIAKARPDAILNLLQGVGDNTSFFRRLRDAGVAPRQVPTISFSLTEKELRNIDRKDMVGDYLASSYFQTVDTEANHDYLKNLEDFLKRAPVTTDSMEAGYVAVHLWAQGVRAAGSIEVSAVRAALGGQSYEGPGGLTLLEPNILCATKYARIGQIHQTGRIDVIWSTLEPQRPQPFPGPRTRKEWEDWLQGYFRRWGGQWFNPGKQ